MMDAGQIVVQVIEGVRAGADPSDVATSTLEALTPEAQIEILEHYASDLELAAAAGPWPVVRAQLAYQVLYHLARAASQDGHGPGKEHDHERVHLLIWNGERTACGESKSADGGATDDRDQVTCRGCLGAPVVARTATTDRS